MALRKLIYHPSGRAGEYADKGYAVNLFKGCTHGCKYCYVPSIMRMKPETFRSACIAAPDVLRRLKADMKQIGVIPEPIFLCFTTDTYCVDAPEGITREAIRIIIESGNRVNILTKGGMRATKDFDLLSSVPGNKIGATLTFSNNDDSAKWEPKAALPLDRTGMLREAKRHGIQTWASIEPVISARQSLIIMELAMLYTDEFKIGKWNHDKRADGIDLAFFVRQTKELMESNGKKYMFKKDLLTV